MFTELLGPSKIFDKMLVNMGESYIAFDLQDQRLSLKVFSSARPDSPDFFCCQHTQMSLVVGRSPNCDIKVDDELLSKVQCSIYH